MGLSNEQVEMLADYYGNLKNVLGDQVFTEILIDYMTMATLSEISGLDNELFQDDEFNKSSFIMFAAGYICKSKSHDQNRH